MKFLARSLISFSILTITQFAQADDIFSTTTTVGSTTKTLSFSSISDLADQFENESLQTTFPTYTPISAASSTINLRGLKDVQLSYAQNSAELVFKIPSLGINKTFGTANGDRDDSQQELLEFLQGKQDEDVLKKINKELVRVSPYDPIIGNPGSLAARMTDATFDNIASATTEATNKALGLASDNSGSITLMPRFGRYTQGGLDTNVVTLPLSYSNWFDGHRLGLVFDMPVTMVKTKDAISANVSFGVGFNIQVAQDWILTPLARAGLAGSADLGSAAAIYSGGLGSNYSFHPADKVTISFLNMVSYYKTSSLTYQDYSTSYDLKNTVLKNGIEYAQHVTDIFNKPCIIKAGYARTDYKGDAVYSRFSNDFSMSIGLANPQSTWFKDLRVGATVTRADHNISGFSLNAGYTF